MLRSFFLPFMKALLVPLSAVFLAALLAGVGYLFVCLVVRLVSSLI